jgi:hypothetical protein
MKTHFDYNKMETLVYYNCDEDKLNKLNGNPRFGNLRSNRDARLSCEIDHLWLKPSGTL